MISEEQTVSSKAKDMSEEEERVNKVAIRKMAIMTMTKKGKQDPINKESKEEQKEYVIL